MKIEKSKLLNTLNKIKYGTKVDKSIDERLNSFIFTGDNIISYNEKTLLYKKFKTDFKCIIPANKFIEIVNKVKSKNIKINLKENKIKIIAGKTKATISCIIHDEIYDIINTFKFSNKKIKWNSLPENFIDGIDINRLSIDRTADNFSSCIFIKNNKVISSDDLRVSIFKMSESINNSMLIPGDILNDFIKFKFTDYFIDNNWVYFKSKDIVFVVRLFDDEYQDNIIDNFDFDGDEIILPDKLIDCIDIASVFSDGESDIEKSINVKIQNNKITCCGINNIGESERTIDIECEKDFSFSINPIFFKQILAMTNKVKIGDDRALFITKNFKHLIALYQE